MPADRLRRQNDVVALRLETFEAAVLAQKGDPGGTWLAEPDRDGVSGAGRDGRGQGGFEGEAGEAVAEVRRGRGR